MCLATASLVAGLAGGAVSGAGALYGGFSHAAQASYMAEVAKRNADYAMQAGQAEAQAVSLKNASRLGKITTQQAAGNVDVNTGSAVKVRASQREVGQLDTETVLNNAALKAWGYRTQAALEENVAQEAPIAGGLEATGDMLSAASSVGTKWAGMQSPNAPAPSGNTGNYDEYGNVVG